VDSPSLAPEVPAHRHYFDREMPACKPGAPSERIATMPRTPIGPGGFDPWLIVFLIIPVLLAIMTIYVMRLNRSHVRLRLELETQLAELRKAQEALRESEVFYHSLVESLPQSILRKDLDGRFTFVNQRFCTALGQPLEQIVGKTDLDFYPAELAEKYRSDDAQVIESRTALETVEENIEQQGKKLYVHVIKTPLFDAAGKIIGIQGIFWDVTARRSAEEKLHAQNEQLQEMALSERQAHGALKQAQSHLVQAEKLAGLGQMVAGVAHEINNPLAFVSNNVAVLQRDIGELRELLELYREGDPVLTKAVPELTERIEALSKRVDMDYTLNNLDGLLKRTRDGLIRIQQIVKDLRAFARLDESDLNEVDLNAGIGSTVNIIQGHAKRKQVQITTELGPLPPVTCYPAKINQVVMNLIVNAIDACSEGGKVTVRTQSKGQGVRIDVIDTGCGIDPAIRDKIFDPFFTTKPVGVGTGLGLSISYGIVQEHGGSISVDSTPGQGSRFSVDLPLRLAATGSN
jgi:two-component system, NtrC family, sensor kinase